MALIEVKVPDIGDFDEVSVIELLVKPGDTVKPEQSLITVESDKASMEIPSAVAGVLKRLTIKLGDKVNIGDLIAIVESAGAAHSAAPVASPSPAPAREGRGEGVVATSQPSPTPSPASGKGSEAPAPVQAAVPAHQPGTPAPGLPHASPSVR